jgi:hypothetical protein
MVVVPRSQHSQFVDVQFGSVPNLVAVNHGDAAIFSHRAGLEPLSLFDDLLDCYAGSLRLFRPKIIDVESIDVADISVLAWSLVQPIAVKDS